MNIISILGLLPGSGKTNVLVKAFHDDPYDESYKYIVAVGNKAVQECRNRLIQLYPDEYGERSLYLKKHVISLRKYKRNYIKLEVKGRRVEYFTTSSIDNCSKKPHHLYIDEKSFVSEDEGNDLLNHFWINNLIIAGDTLQHKPIGEKWVQKNSDNEPIKDEDNRLLYKYDEGNAWNIKPTLQICLNKQLRSKDERLVEVLQLIKEGRIIDALQKCKVPNEPFYSKKDWHICYSNNKCDHINKMYNNVYFQKERWIVVENDNDLGFYKGEVYDENDEAFLYKKEQYKIKCITKGDINKTFEKEWEEYMKYYFAPAYALTSHKLQGSKIENGDIFIHLDDGWYSSQKSEDVQSFQRFLYVSFSRAVSLDQINIMGDFDVYNMETTELGRVIREYDEECMPLVDKTIKKDDIYCSAEEPTLVNIILSHFTNDENKNQPIYKRIKNIISEAHSVKHKQHKQKYTDEYLQSFETVTDLRKITKNQKVINRYYKLKGL